MGKERPTPHSSVVTGSVAVDTIIDFPGYLREHAQQNSAHFFAVSLLVEQMRVTFGGTAINMAYTQALLGLQPDLLASIGSDRVHMLKKLEQVGVNTQHVHVSDRPTANFFVITDMEHSQIAVFHKGAMADEHALHLQPWENLNAVLLMAAHDPNQMMLQIRECEEHNVRLVFAIGQQVNNVPVELLEAGVDQAEVMILNDNELNDLAKKLHLSAQELANTVPISVTTLGRRGSLIRGSSLEEAVRIPVANPVEVKDPTGCGDAYAAGFLRGYLSGFDLATCGKMGALAATYVLEQHGTIEHSYSLRDFMERFQREFSVGVDLDFI